MGQPVNAPSRRAEFGANAMQGGGQEARVDPNSKWCRWCQKRFKNEAVYNGHLTGKVRAAAPPAAPPAPRAAL